MSVPDPVSIDAVAAVLAWTDGVPEVMPLHVRLARALAEAGWLRTAEDRAVLDAADIETRWEDELIRFGDDPQRTRELALIEAKNDRARVVRARRGAAGGTEARPDAVVLDKDGLILALGDYVATPGAAYRYRAEKALAALRGPL